MSRFKATVGIERGARAAAARNASSALASVAEIANAAQQAPLAAPLPIAKMVALVQGLIADGYSPNSFLAQFLVDDEGGHLK